MSCYVRVFAYNQYGDPVSGVHTLLAGMSLFTGDDGYTEYVECICESGLHIVEITPPDGCEAPTEEHNYLCVEGYTEVRVSLVCDVKTGCFVRGFAYAWSLGKYFPISGASVEIEGSSYLTDETGYTRYVRVKCQMVLRDATITPPDGYTCYKGKCIENYFGKEGHDTLEFRLNAPPPPTISALSWKPKGDFYKLSTGASLAGTDDDLYLITTDPTEYPDLMETGEAMLQIYSAGEGGEGEVCQIEEFTDYTVKCIGLLYISIFAIGTNSCIFWGRERGSGEGCTHNHHEFFEGDATVGQTWDIPASFFIDHDGVDTTVELISIDAGVATMKVCTAGAPGTGDPTTLPTLIVRETDTFNFNDKLWHVLNIICGPECSFITLADENAEAARIPKIGDEIQFQCSIDWHDEDEDEVRWYYGKPPNRCFDEIGWTLFANEQFPTHVFEAEDDTDIVFIKAWARNKRGQIGELGDGCSPVFNLWAEDMSWWEPLLEKVRTVNKDIATPITDLFINQKIEGWTEPPFKCPICEQVFNEGDSELEYAKHLMSHIKAFEGNWFKR